VTLKDMQQGTQVTVQRQRLFSLLEDMRNEEEEKWKASGN
jgi:hypothetical protein